MKKLFISLTMVAALGLNAAAYFDGNVTGTTGPDSYRGTKLDLVIGNDSMSLEPMLDMYRFDKNSFGGKTLRTYTLRGALEGQKHTLGAFAGMTPEVSDYSNKFAGADITFTLTPGAGGHSRLAGPASRSVSSGGGGVSRIDVGAGVRYTAHTLAQAVGSDLKTAQTAGSLFAGAKILMVNLSASFTAYTYGDKNAPALGFVGGHNFVTASLPKSSVNVKLDLPGQPLITPYISYTGAKYRAFAGKAVPDTSAYLLGAYIDLNLVTANVGYQIFDNGSSKDSFITLGAGIKF